MPVRRLRASLAVTPGGFPALRVAGTGVLPYIGAQQRRAPARKRVHVLE